MSVTTRVYGICALLFRCDASVVGTTLGTSSSVTGNGNACFGFAGSAPSKLVGGANGVRYLLLPMVAKPRFSGKVVVMIGKQI